MINQEKRFICPPFPQIENQMGLKTFNSTSTKELFKLPYNIKEISKVPFYKQYRRDKLFFMGPNSEKEPLPVITIQSTKRSLSHKAFLPLKKENQYSSKQAQFIEEMDQPKPRTANEPKKENKLVKHINRVKLIYGKGKLYELKHQYDKDRNQMFGELLKDIKSEKNFESLSFFKELKNPSKITWRSKENLIEYQQEKESVLELERWKKKALQPKVIY